MPDYEIDEDLGLNGGHVLFADAEDAESWLEKERVFWDWLRQTELKGNNELQSARDKIINNIDSLSSHVENWKAANDASQQINNIRHRLELYQSGQTIHSTSPDARAIDQIREEVGEFEALVALAVTVEPTINLTKASLLPGAITFVLFREGVTKRSTAAIRKALEDLLAKFDELHTDNKRKGDELRGNLEALVEEHELTDQRALSAHAAAVRQARAKASSQRKEAETRLKDLEELFRKKLSLQAPIAYWSKKRLKHRIVGGVTGVLFVAYLVLVGFYVWWLGQNTGLGNLEFWKQIEIGTVGLIAITVGIVVALARVLYRLFLSQLHLGNDADERVTMVNTYLALVDQGHAKEEFMKSVLERLFAPAADGIVKDDIGPVTAADALSRMFKS